MNTYRNSAIRSNSFRPIASNLSRGSSSEQFVWTNCSELLPWDQLGAIGLNELLRIANAGQIGSNWSKQIAPNCSRGSNWEQLVYTNCSELLPGEQLFLINFSELLQRERLGAIGNSMYESRRSQLFQCMTPAGVKYFNMYYSFRSQVSPIMTPALVKYAQNNASSIFSSLVWLYNSSRLVVPSRTFLWEKIGYVPTTVLI